MKNRVKGLIITFIAIFIWLVFSPTAGTRAATGLRDYVTTKDTIILIPKDDRYRSAVLFEVSGDARYGSLAEDTKPGFIVSNVTYVWPETADEDMDFTFLDFDFDTRTISYTGDRKNPEKYYGIETGIEITLLGSSGETYSFSTRVILTEERIVIEGEQLLMPGQTVKAGMISGAGEIVEAKWQSSNPDILKVTQDSTNHGISAKLEGIKTGKATVTVQVRTADEVFTVKRDYTVNWAPGKAVLNFEKLTLYKGDSVELLLSNLPEKSKVTYSSSKSSVAKVDKSTGRITAKKKGKAKITVTIKAPATDYAKAQTYKLTCTVTVKSGSKVKSVSSAAQLKKYLTDKKGGRLKLTKDIMGIDFNITIKKGSYRLDLNGFSIRGKGGMLTNGIIDVEGGKLVILDSKGKSELINDYSQEAVGCTKKGTLNIYGGGIWGLNYAVYNDGGTTNIYGGRFYAYGQAVKQFGGKLNIYGGSFESLGDNISDPELGNHDGLYVCNTGKAVVKGGTFIGENGIDIAGTGSVKLDNCTVDSKFDTLSLWGGKAEIKGGSYTCAQSNVIFVCPIREKVDIVINGGLFVSKNYGNFLYAQNDCDIDITSGIFKRDVEHDADYDYEYNTLVCLAESFKGSYNADEAIIPAKELTDMTAAGQGISVTEFKRTKTTYKPGMTVKNADELYSAVMDACERLNSKIELNMDSELYRIFDYYFGRWLSIDMMIASAYDSIPTGASSYKVTIDITYRDSYMLQRVCFNSELSSKVPKNIRKCATAFDEVYGECVKGKSSKLDKVKAFHDYMCDRYTYDYSFEADSYYPQGLLLNGKGVCQGYAMLYQWLCEKANIECEIIEGFAGEPGSTLELHAWNKVIIDGKELYVDVTFDDGAGTTKWCLKDEKTFYADGYHIPF